MTIAYAWRTNKPKIDRTGTTINGITLTRGGMGGAWFGKCSKCGSERVYTKEKISRQTIRCCP